MSALDQEPWKAGLMTSSTNVLGRLTAENLKPSVSRAPNVLRLLFRILQLIASLAAFVLGIVCFKKLPEEADVLRGHALNLLFFTSLFSFFAAIFFTTNYYHRRMEYQVKIKRIYLLSLDLITLIFWVSDLAVILLNPRCPIGGLSGWCDVYNSTIFFGFVSLFAIVVSFCWDVFGTWFQE